MGIQIRFVISARAEGHDALADLTRAHARPISWQVAPGGIYIPPPVASLSGCWSKGQIIMGRTAQDREDRAHILTLSRVLDERKQVRVDDQTTT